jgi:large subunit ribosomal protein L28
MRERKCDLAGTRQNSKCMNVSKSRAHTHRVQNVNLQTMKFFWEEEGKTVKLRISTRTLKTIKKYGVGPTAKKYGVDLKKFSVSFGTRPTMAAAVAA